MSLSISLLHHHSDQLTVSPSLDVGVRYLLFVFKTVVAYKVSSQLITALSRFGSVIHCRCKAINGTFDTALDSRPECHCASCFACPWIETRHSLVSGSHCRYIALDGALVVLQARCPNDLTHTAPGLEAGRRPPQIEMVKHSTSRELNDSPQSSAIIL